MYSAEMGRMQALFSRLEEERKDRVFELCGPLTVVSAVEIKSGVGAFDASPARRRRRGSQGGSKGGAWFYGQVRLCELGGQRGIRVNTSCDRVLRFPIRKHALLLYGSEKKGNCQQVELPG